MTTAAHLISHNLPSVKQLQCFLAVAPGQIALAWLLAQYDRLVPIPGTRHIDYLIENAAATEVMLEEADVALLNDLHQRIEVKGDRYSEEGMKGVNA